MEPSDLVARYGVWIFVYINLGIGLALGLVPLSVGFIKGRAKVGIGGFFACLIGGAILGVFLSLPACVIFTWLSIRRPKPVASVDSDE